MRVILIIVLAALLALPWLIWLSARMTLDRSLAHTRAAVAARFELPLYHLGSTFQARRSRWRYSTPLNADPLGGHANS
jgi:hypothetical protein